MEYKGYQIVLCGERWQVFDGRTLLTSTWAANSAKNFVDSLLADDSSAEKPSFARNSDK